VTELPLARVPRFVALPQLAFAGGGGGGGGGRLQVMVATPPLPKLRATVPAAPLIEHAKPFKLLSDDRPAASNCQSVAQPVWDGSQLVFGVAVLALVGTIASQ
jgi:hypothetical protein